MLFFQRAISVDERESRDGECVCLVQSCINERDCGICTGMHTCMLACVWGLFMITHAINR